MTCTDWGRVPLSKPMGLERARNDFSAKIPVKQ